MSNEKQFGNLVLSDMLPAGLVQGPQFYFWVVKPIPPHQEGL